MCIDHISVFFTSLITELPMNRNLLATLSILALILISPIARADLRDGLISYWPFDGNGADASGFERDLTLEGGLGFESGLFGQALDMHKNQDAYAHRPDDDAAYNFGGSDFTIQVWVNYYSTDTEQVFMEKFTGDGGPGWTFTKLAEDRGHSYLFYGNGAGYNISPPQSIPISSWIHVLARRSGEHIEIWRDGVEIASGSNGTISDTSTPLYVGRRNHGDIRDFSKNGRLDEVAIWNRAISDDEIAYLYNDGLGHRVIAVPEPSMIQLAVLAMLPLAWRRT